MSINTHSKSNIGKVCTILVKTNTSSSLKEEWEKENCYLCSIVQQRHKPNIKCKPLTRPVVTRYIDVAVFAYNHTDDHRGAKINLKVIQLTVLVIAHSLMPTPARHNLNTRNEYTQIVETTFLFEKHK